MSGQLVCANHPGEDCSILDGRLHSLVIGRYSMPEQTPPEVAEAAADSEMNEEPQR